MSLAKKAADAYALAKKAKKVKDYATLVKGAVDEDTRTGALFKLGIKATVDIAGKVLGSSLSNHPYYALHKAHFEALSQALNASSNLDKASAAFLTAVKSADATEKITKAITDYQGRKNALRLMYWVLIADSLGVLKSPTSPDSMKILQETGFTQSTLQAWVDNSIYEWRALWCDLYFDSLQLLTMAYAELKSTQEAMARFDKKMKAMSEGGNMGRIAAFRAEQDRQWEQFDRMTKPGRGDARAIEDPVKYARERVNSIEGSIETLGSICEFVLENDSYDTNKVGLIIGSR